MKPVSIIKSKTQYFTYCEWFYDFQIVENQCFVIGLFWLIILLYISLLLEKIKLQITDNQAFEILSKKLKLEFKIELKKHIHQINLDFIPN